MIGGVVTLGALFLPGMRDIEGEAAEQDRKAEGEKVDLLSPPAIVDLRS